MHVILWQMLLPYVLADVYSQLDVEDVKPHLFLNLLQQV